MRITPRGAGRTAGRDLGILAIAVAQEKCRCSSRPCGEPLPWKITDRMVEVRNHLGEKVSAASGKVGVGPGVIYLVGPERVELP